MIEIFDRSLCSDTWEVSILSTRIPPSILDKRNKADMIDDLPAPVRPTIPT